MKKENVFLVCGREMIAGEPRGGVLSRVVCSVDENSARKLMAEKFPRFWVITVTSLVMLDDRAKKVKAVLQRADKSWPLTVDPVLLAMDAG